MPIKSIRRALLQLNEGGEICRQKGVHDLLRKSLEPQIGVTPKLHRQKHMFLPPPPQVRPRPNHQELGRGDASATVLNRKWYPSLLLPGYSDVDASDGGEFYPGQMNVLVLPPTAILAYFSVFSPIAVLIEDSRSSSSQAL